MVDVGYGLSVTTEEALCITVGFSASYVAIVMFNTGVFSLIYQDYLLV
jgi:hypothetical protein